jgi:hypothetical protein
MGMAKIQQKYTEIPQGRLKIRLKYVEIPGEGDQKIGGGGWCGLIMRSAIATLRNIRIGCHTPVRIATSKNFR